MMISRLNKFHKAYEGQSKRQIKDGNQVELRIQKSVFDKGSKPIFTKTVHKIISRHSNGMFEVSDRKHFQKPYDLQKTQLYETLPESSIWDYTAVRMINQHIKTKRIIERRLNKEGINEPENIVQDINARIMRRFNTNRDFGPFIQN